MESSFKRICRRYLCIYFPSDAEVGADALEILNLHDEVLKLSLTPNRADCLNMLGVAYEVAAIYGREVKLPAISFTRNSTKNF